MFLGSPENKGFGEGYEAKPSPCTAGT